MINKDEMLFTVDEDNNPIEPQPRQRVHSEGIWHRTNHILVLNLKREVLCNKRSMLKDTSPGEWAIYFGGHVLSSSNPLDSAVEELNEEAGLAVKATDLKFIGIYSAKSKKPTQENNEIIYLYTYHWDGEANNIIFEKDEVDEVKWMDKEMLRKEILDNPNVWKPPYFNDFLNNQL